MKAMVYTRYGSPDVLHLAEVAKPTPKNNEVLVKIYATTVTAGDTRMRSFTVPRGDWLFSRLFLGIFRPRRRILGMELAGVVEAVGREVTRFKPGDSVFASCGLRFAAYAEYKCLPETAVMAIKPSTMSYEEAAAVPVGGGTAVRLLRRANIQRGQQVLIYGASGSVGSYAVQLARSYGAVVTGVCSTANVELVKSLGAEQVIDYTQEDFTQCGETYDVIVDTVGKLSPAQGKQSLNPAGRYISVHKETSREKVDYLILLKELIEAGKITAVIDRRYPFDQIPEAHRYVDAGHKKGNVVITIHGGEK
jgi:NADPH:quinone reductase-like Zn-dependent oxidoreductase